MKKRNILIIFLIIVSFSVSGFAIEKKLIEKYKKSVAPMIFPNSYVYTLYYSLNLNYLKKEQKLEKKVIDFYQILNRAGRDKYGDYKIRYINGKENLKIIEATTLNKSLKLTPVEKKAINTITPASLQGASLYADILDRVYSYQDIDPEDAIYMEYIKTSDNKDGEIGLTFLFQNNTPASERALKIDYPSSNKLFYKLKGDKIIGSFGKSEYKWSLTDIAKLEIEEHSPPAYYLSPYVIVSSSKDWKAKVNKLYKDFEKAIIPDKTIISKTNKIIKKVKTEREKLYNIYGFITKRIKSIPLPLGLVGYTPHKASVVLKKGYGDIRDKSALMISMLKAAGFNSYPVFIPTNREPEKELVVMDQFGYILVAVSLKNEKIYLDPFGEYRLMGYFGITEKTDGLAIVKDKLVWEKVKYPENIKNCVKSEIALKLKKDMKFNVDIKIKANGFFDSMVRRALSLSNKDDKNKYFMSSASSFSEGATSLSYKIENLNNRKENTMILQKIKGKGLSVKQGKVSILSIPSLPYDFTNFPYSVSLKSRKYPFYFGAKFNISEKWEISSEEKFKPLYLPEQIKINNDNYSFSLNTIFKNGKIIIQRDISIKKTMFSRELYKEFKKDFDKFNTWKLKTILFEEAK
jgi:hypothetical protein